MAAAVAHGVGAAEFWDLTLADLRIIIRARVHQAAKHTRMLGWYAGYYGRVKNMPSLLEELEEVDEAFEPDDEQEEDAKAVRARRDATWARVKASVMAWNAHFEGKGA